MSWRETRKWNMDTVALDWAIDPIFAWGPQGEYETGVYYRHGWKNSQICR